MIASICGVVAETDTQFAMFDLSAFVEQLTIFHSMEVCPKFPEYSFPPLKIDIDNKALFRYLSVYWF